MISSAALYKQKKNRQRVEGGEKNTALAYGPRRRKKLSTAGVILKSEAQVIIVSVPSVSGTDRFESSHSMASELLGNLIITCLRTE